MFFIFLFVVAANGRLSENVGARLLLHKQILNKYLVESKDIIVKYTMHNVGNSAATEVQLSDSFDRGVFVQIAGNLPAKIHALRPNQNVSHVLIVRPNTYGYFNCSCGKVSYKDSHTSGAFKVTFSNEPGIFKIMEFREYDKRFSSHFWDWLVFAVMVAPLIGTPFALWYYSDSKYRKITLLRKKNR